MSEHAGSFTFTCWLMHSYPHHVCSLDIKSLPDIVCMAPSHTKYAAVCVGSARLPSLRPCLRARLSQVCGSRRSAKLCRIVGHCCSHRQRAVSDLSSTGRRGPLRVLPGG